MEPKLKFTISQLLHFVKSIENIKTVRFSVFCLGKNEVILSGI